MHPSHFISFPLPVRDKKTCRHKNFPTTNLKTLGHGRWGGGAECVLLMVLCFCLLQSINARENMIKIYKIHTTYTHTHTHTLNQYENFCSSPNTNSRRPSGKIEIVKSKAIKYISNYFDCKFPLPYWIFISPTKLSGTTAVQSEKEMQLYQNGD